MCFHFVNQYGNSKAVPLMLLAKSPGLGPQGVFWFFAAVTLVGLAYVVFCSRDGALVRLLQLNIAGKD